MYNKINNHQHTFEIKYLILTDIGHGKQDYSNVTMNDRPILPYFGKRKQVTYHPNLSY